MSDHFHLVSLLKLESSMFSFSLINGPERNMLRMKGENRDKLKILFKIQVTEWVFYPQKILCKFLKTKEITTKKEKCHDTVVTKSRHIYLW